MTVPEAAWERSVPERASGSQEEEGRIGRGMRAED